MLSKLHFPTTATSLSNESLEKLRSLHELVDSAISHKLATDATSRNALTKIATAVGKVVGERVASRGDATVVDEDKTVLDDEKSVIGKRGEGEMKIEDEEEGGTKIEEGEGETKTEVVEEQDTVMREGNEDSLLEQLLEDEDEEEL